MGFIERLLNNSLQPSDWQLLQAATASVRAVRCTASAAASAYELLTGVTHVYLNARGGKIWDFAAVEVAITEAAGIAADPHGYPLSWDAVAMTFMAASSVHLMQQWLAVSAGGT